MEVCVAVVCLLDMEVINLHTCLCSHVSVNVGMHDYIHMYT